MPTRKNRPTGVGSGATLQGSEREQGAAFAAPCSCAKFKEPVALSSTEPADFPLPRTALELGFDLLALRAPCTRESSRYRLVRARAGPGDCRKLRRLSLPATPSRAAG